MRKFVLTALAAFVFAVPAAAAEGAEEESVVVTYDDLDLSSPAGAAELDRRIEAAAEKVCRRPRLLDLKAMTSWQECKAASVEDAREQLSFTGPFESFALTSLF